MEINNDKTLTATICWDKTQMLLKGCTDQIPTWQPKALCSFLPTFIRPPKTLPSWRERAVSLSAALPTGLLLQERKERKKKISTQKLMARAVCCYIPFFNNFECISGHWHFNKMSEYLLYQTPWYLRLTWFPLGCSQSLWNCLRLQQLQGRPLREIENSHTEWTSERQRTPSRIQRNPKLNWKG